MNLCRIARAPGRLLFQVMFTALGTATVLAPLLVRAQAPSHRAAQANRPPSSDATISQIREAASLLEQGRPADAEPILRQVLLAAPRNPDAHNLLGIVLDQRGEFKAAEQEYRSALRLNPSLISPLANLGVLLARTDRSDEAVKIFESVLRAAPDHPPATLNLGLQYALRGDDARAVPLLQRAIALGLDSYEVRYRLGVSLHNLKRMDEAAQAFESALTLSPNAAEPYYYLGLIAWAGGHDTQAEDLWDRAVTLRPNFPEANFMLGEALRKSQRTRASIDFYKRALEQDPSKFAYYARLGGVYIVLGEGDQAAAVFHRGLLRFPNLPEAHYFAGVAARAIADYTNAEAEQRKVLALEPNNVNALAQLGFVLLERDRMTEGETTLRRAIAINDRHYYANYDLGRLLVKSRRYDQALPILRHAAALKPRNPGVHYQLFIALSRLKRKDEADRELTTFKELDQDRKSNPKSEVEIEDDAVENSSPPIIEPNPGKRPH